MSTGYEFLTLFYHGKVFYDILEKKNAHFTAGCSSRGHPGLIFYYGVIATECLDLVYRMNGAPPSWI